MTSAKKSFIATLPTPSITQQRIIVALLLAFIGAAAWWQRAGGGAHYPAQSPLVQKFSTTPVSDAVAALDFTDTEATWSSLKFDSQGNLLLDELTETALSDAIELTRNQPSTQASELATSRVALLLEKQFGATASRQTMQLLSQLNRYKDAEQRFWEENSNKNPPPHAELFQLQDQMLGAELAEKLFSQQRRLAKTMLASQQIQNDARLTQAEKDQAIRELQKALQAEGASSE